jgi:uncharacterized YccA/Bax inhibitor family protein
MPTANPATSEAVYGRAGFADSPAEVMTLKGTIVKTAALVAILLVTAAYAWSKILAANADDETVTMPAKVIGLLILGTLGGFITALVTIFVPRVSPFTAPLYGALEGLALGGISGFFEAAYAGIVVHAVGLTIGILLSLLAIYAAGFIRASEKFKIGVVAATGGICLVYLADLIISFFGMDIPFIHETGWMGIGFSLFVVIIAAANLILDFDFIEKGVKRRAPKYMEWYGGFSLLVTLVWLYLEVLRLLSKLKGSRD